MLSGSYLGYGWELTVWDGGVGICPSPKKFEVLSRDEKGSV